MRSMATGKSLALWGVTLLVSSAFAAGGAFAQAKKSPPAPARAKTFTVDFNEATTNGLPVTMNATIRETRQGTAVKQTDIEVCFARSPVTRRVDRFTTTLTLREGAWRGTAVTILDKTPVEVTVVRSGKAGAWSFTGEIRHTGGAIKFEQADTNFSEDDATQDNVATNDVSPPESRDISLNSVSIVVQPAALPALLPVLRKHRVKMKSSGLIADCESLRTNAYSVGVEVDPAHARMLVQEASAIPGVVRAGWIAGTTIIGDAIRIPAGPYGATDKPDKEKLLSAIAKVISSTIGQAQFKPHTFDANAGFDRLHFAGASIAQPNAGLQDTTEINLQIAPESLQSRDFLVIYIDDIERSIGDPAIKMSDGKAGESEGGESDSGVRKAIQAAIARALQGETWDIEKQAWVKQ